MVDHVGLPLSPGDTVRGKEFVPANQLTEFGDVRDAAPDDWL